MKNEDGTLTYERKIYGETDNSNQEEDNISNALEVNILYFESFPFRLCRDLTNRMMYPIQSSYPPQLSFKTRINFFPN